MENSTSDQSTDNATNNIPNQSVPPGSDQPTVHFASPEAPLQQYAEPVYGAPTPIAPTGLNAGMPGQPYVPQPVKKSKKRLVISLVGVLLVVLVAGGYAFAFYLPNRPSNMYSSGLKTSGEAVDKLITYADQAQSTKYQSTALSASIKVKSPSISFDGTLNGNVGKSGNTDLKATADVMGNQVSGELRTVVAKGNTTPDIYIKLDNAKSLLNSYGLQGLSGQWVSIDHTLIDTFLSQQQSVSSGSISKTGAPSSAEVNDAIARSQAVNKQYLFTTDKTKAVATDQHFVGKETQNGRTVYHYTDGYSKTHLEAYIDALGTALDGSKLDSWSKAVEGKNLSQATDLGSLKKSVQNAKAGYTFDLWIDAKTKLISKLSFVDPTDKSTLTIGQGYVGGSVYPFNLSVSGKDNGKPENAALSLAFNNDTKKVTLGFSGNFASGSGSESAVVSLSLTPSTKPVTVVAPTGAASFTDVLDELILGTLTGGSSGAPSTSLLGSELE